MNRVHQVPSDLQSRTIPDLGILEFWIDPEISHFEMDAFGWMAINHNIPTDCGSARKQAYEGNMISIVTYTMIKCLVDISWVQKYAP